MKNITKESVIKRNARIGRFATYGGLIILAGGIFISFSSPQQITLPWVSLLAGFILTQVGLFYGNRWGRRPRPNEHLDNALKGLDDRYTIYHYSTPVAHLLLGPSGIWILIPYHQIGIITYVKGRWRQKGGGFVQSYLRLFAQEGIGRPEIEIASQTEALERFFTKKIPEVTFPKPQVALVFTNERAILQTDDAPTPTLSAKGLKEHIRKSAKNKSISADQLKILNDLFSGVVSTG